MTIAMIGFAILLLLIFFRLPIAFAMGIVGFGGIWVIDGFEQAAVTVAFRFEGVTQNYELAVLPMFILMGNLVAKAGLSHELYDASNAFLGHRRGGLSMATVVACGGFSAICGSSLATAATMSKVAMPSMRRYGYSDSLATASIAAGGTLGILIPPSVVLVIYGIMTETSIRELFAAGFLPGLIGILFYLGAVQYTVARDPSAGPRVERIPWAKRWQPLMMVSWTLALFALVMGGIYIGFFTPNEAAGVGAFGAFAIAMMRRRLSWADIRDVLVDATRTSATLFVVLIGALTFANFVNIAGLPDGLKALVTGGDMSPVAVIIVILLIYIALGCVFESLSMLLLTIPVFYPVVQALAAPITVGGVTEFPLGVEPRWVLVWFGILAVVVTEISLITPPVGLNVFVLSGVLKDVKTTTIFKGVTPFWAVDVMRLAVLLFVPPVAIILPKLFYG
jgi:tripartite ATP-independent transporter DctM subunit